MKVIVIFGGKSSEHDVSCVSAAGVIENMGDHDVIKIGVTKDGKWFRTDASTDEMRNGDWEKCNNEAVTADINEGCFVSGGRSLKADVVFPLIHGRNGEDGRLQGMLEMMRIPYVGCRVLGSAVCMDKAIANALFVRAGINHVPWVEAQKSDFDSDRDQIIKQVINELKFPVFVKPANAGSSVGISKCNNADTLEKAFETAFIHDTRVVVEQGIENVREIETAVLGNDEPIVSVTGRVAAASEFYDYDAKYKNPESRLFIPADISEKLSDEIRGFAVKAYKGCDCKGLARVDFFLDENDNVYINEINTIPGFTPISMYPKLFGACGISFPELINKLLNFAIEYGA